jgi:tRNA threonylcarbamoyladenosine biosynthesis protein TsaB
MKYLALDSTAKAATVALCENDALIGLFSVNAGNTHSETILPMIEAALKSCGWTISDVDCLVCSAGPGSFTGVRIGVATVKGLAFGTEKPCVGVSTLEALAENLLAVPVGSLICPVMNARRNQVYTATFRRSESGMERLTPDRAIAISELDAELSEQSDGAPVYFCGDGYDVTIPALRETKAANTPILLREQNAYSVAQCGRRAYEAGKAVPEAELVPIYLRPSQAERERLERAGNPAL